MNSTRNLFGAVALTALTAGTASAAVFATNPSGIWGDGGSIVTAGTTFSVGSKAVVIPSLGLFDENGDGMAFAESVGIYTTGATPTLLGSVTIKAGKDSVFHDGSRWESLTKPLELNANTTYLLAWTVRQNGDPINVIDDPSKVVIDPLLSLGQSGYSYTQTGISGLNFPDLGQRSFGYYAFGGNLEVFAVPEPATTACFVGVGLIGFAAWRRSRSNAAAQ